MNTPHRIPGRPLRAVIIEDEGLLALQLETILEDAGHQVLGWATSLADARTLVDRVEADLAFVDVHLADGPTGVQVAEYIEKQSTATVVFMTANAKRLPSDLVGAVGVIAKPYTQAGILAALRYLHEGVRAPPPTSLRPSGLTLSPETAARWQAAEETSS